MTPPPPLPPLPTLSKATDELGFAERFVLA
jgi:hypothetical protein